MSHAVQFSPGHQDPRQTEISLSKGLPANSATASEGKGEAWCQSPLQIPNYPSPEVTASPAGQGCNFVFCHHLLHPGGVTALAITSVRPDGTCKASYAARPSSPLPSSKSSAVPARGQHAACSSRFLTAMYSGMLFFPHDSTLPELLSQYTLIVYTTHGISWAVWQCPYSQLTSGMQKP